MGQVAIRAAQARVLFHSTGACVGLTCAWGCHVTFLFLARLGPAQHADSGSNKHPAAEGSVCLPAPFEIIWHVPVQGSCLQGPLQTHPWPPRCWQPSSASPASTPAMQHLPAPWQEQVSAPPSQHRQQPLPTRQWPIVTS